MPLLLYVPFLKQLLTHIQSFHHPYLLLLQPDYESSQLILVVFDVLDIVCAHSNQFGHSQGKLEACIVLVWYSLLF